MHHKSHAAFKTSLISVSITVTAVLGAFCTCVCVCVCVCVCLNLTIPSPTFQLWLWSLKQEMSHQGEGKREKCQPSITPFLIHPMYTGPTLYLRPQVGLTTATLGGRELQEKAWSSPISNKWAPKSRQCFPAAEKPVLPGGVLESPCAVPSCFLHHLALTSSWGFFVCLFVCLFFNLCLIPLESPSSFVLSSNTTVFFF